MGFRCHVTRYRTSTLEARYFNAVKMHDKYNKQIPEYLTRQLKEAANTVAELDRKMEHINKEVNILKENDTSNDADPMLFNPRDLMIQMMNGMDIKKLN